MAISLYDATVPQFRQTLGATLSLLGKAEEFLAQRGLAPEELLGARLAGDMLPFPYQVRFVAMHSQGALEGVRSGRYSPDRSAPPLGFAALRACLDEALAAVNAATPGEVNAFAGREVHFEAGDIRMDFAAEDFLLSFSLPNFFFHATTAYDLLRMKGVPIGKRDFLGAVRIKG